MSGYLLGVNPFDQPGVEAYKKNMFALLGKPGFEELKAELEEFKIIKAAGSGRFYYFIEKSISIFKLEWVC